MPNLNSLSNAERATGFSRKIVVTVISAIAFILLAAFSTSLFEIVDADEVVIIQTLSGNLKVVVDPGPTWQGFGNVTSFPRLDIYEFEAPIWFNDAGEATLKGSIQWECPLDEENIKELKTKYGSADGIRDGVVNKVVDKCVFMTGPLMSSAESYATKKTDLIRYIEDQITKGVYKTFTKEEKIDDPITGQKKSVKVTEILFGKSGIPERQEEPVLASLGINTSNLAISNIEYSDKVRQQISEQQKITMEVQTSIADARKAEQRYITITKNGEADAAQAKWEQEKEKAKYVTIAQQKLEVAELDRKAAEQEKQATILRAEGEAAKRAKMMQADNALAMRLDAQVKMVEAISNSLKGSRMVPEMVFGGTGTNNQTAVSNAEAMMSMMLPFVAKMTNSINQPLPAHQSQE